MRQICNEISGVFGIHRYLISMDLQFIKRFKLLFQYSHCYFFKDGSFLLSGSNNGVPTIKVDDLTNLPIFRDVISLVISAISDLRL